jgi:hypothetical protein
VNADRLRFRNEMENYIPPDQATLQAQEEAKRRPKKDPNRPKRPPTAYLLFTNAVRASYIAQYPEKSNPEIMKGLAEMWGNASEEDKAAYLPEVKRLADEYAEKMKHYVRFVFCICFELLIPMVVDVCLANRILFIFFFFPIT